MPETDPSPDKVTTINYTLEWPHLENPSNTTFAGQRQIDVCRCGPKTLDLGHIYTRSRCSRPEIRFAPPGDDLWVLQAPLGQVNLLRPANNEELQRRNEIHNGAEPTAYAGKNFLLLSGPCPRGRYQAYATLRFLMALSPEAREHVEYISLLIQPYEEDCSDDQGGRAYVELAQYIRDRVPSFKTLYLNIWAEETRIWSREFALLLWRDNISIIVNWDWANTKTEEYTDVATYLRGIETGVVAKRPVFQDLPNVPDRVQRQMFHRSRAQLASAKRMVPNDRRVGVMGGSRGAERSDVTWIQVAGYHEDEGDLQRGQRDDAYAEYEESLECDESERNPLEKSDLHEIDSTTETFKRQQTDLEDDWSDAGLTPLSPSDSEDMSTYPHDSCTGDGSDMILTPLSRHGGDESEDSGWQVL